MNKKICFYASEVASVLGKNRYNPKTKAINEVVNRTKNKNYTNINDRVQNKLEATINNMNINISSTDVLCNVKTAIKKEIESKINEKCKPFNTVLVHTKNIVNEEPNIIINQSINSQIDINKTDIVKDEQIICSPIMDNVIPDLLVDDMNLMVDKLVVTELLPSKDDLYKDEIPIPELPVVNIDADIVVQDVINNELNINIEISKDDISELETYSEKDIDKFIGDIANKTYGRQQESCAIMKYESTHNTKIKHNNDKPYYINRDNYCICGKIDGITEDGVLIEIKNRESKLYYELYEREKIQLMIYMKMLGVNVCKLVERCNGEQNEIIVEYDDKYFNNILDQLNSVADIIKNKCK